VALHERIVLGWSGKERCSCGWPGKYIAGGARSATTRDTENHIQRERRKLDKEPNSTARAIAKFRQLRGQRRPLQGSSLSGSPAGVCFLCGLAEGHMVLPPDWSIHPSCAERLADMRRSGAPLPPPAGGFPEGVLEQLVSVTTKVELGALARRLGLGYMEALRLALSYDPKHFKREQSARPLSAPAGEPAKIRSPRRIIRKMLDNAERPEFLAMVVKRLASKPGSGFWSSGWRASRGRASGLERGGFAQQKNVADACDMV